MLDKQAFIDGCNSRIKKEAEISLGGFGRAMGSLGDAVMHPIQALTAGTGGIRDKIWNNTAKPVADGMAKEVMSSVTNHLGKAVGQENIVMGPNGAIDPQATAQRLGQSMTPKFVEGAKTGLQESLAKTFNWDTSKPWMENLKNFPGNNPMTTGLLGAGLGIGGYGIGKSLGLWGNSNSSNNNAPAPNGGSQWGSAYTAKTPAAPQALTKASGFVPIVDGVNMRTSDLVLPRSLAIPTMLGSGLIGALREPEAPPPTPQEVNVDPENKKTEKALQDPHMQAYIKSLVRKTF